jgi:hypothetical protein
LRILAAGADRAGRRPFKITVSHHGGPSSSPSKCPIRAAFSLQNGVDEKKAKKSAGRPLETTSWYVDCSILT